MGMISDYSSAADGFRLGVYAYSLVKLFADGVMTWFTTPPAGRDCERL